METKVIMKYHRRRERWLCSSCEAENEMTMVRCAVCGENRKVSDSILRTFDESVGFDNHSTDPYQKNHGSCYVHPGPDAEMGMHPAYDEKQPKSNSWKWYVAAVIFIILAVLGGINSEACGLVFEEIQPEFVFELAGNLSERLLIL